MLLIVGTVRIPVENVARARPAVARLIEATRAEDGCLKYGFAEDVLDPGLIHISEAWRDQAALEAHFASAHIAEWRTVWREIGIRDRDLRLYEVGEGRAL